MMARIPSWLAPVIVALTAALVVVGVPFAEERSDVIASIAIGAWLLITGGVGALITARRRGHPVGWILVSLAVIATAHGLVQNYAKAGLERGFDLPAEVLAAWLSTWLGFPAIGLFILLVLLFPTGSLPSARWRILVTATVASVGTMIVLAALTPGPFAAIPSVENPVGVEALSRPIALLSALVSFVPAMCAFAAVGSQVVRLRRSRGDERQQIKFVAYAIVMAPILIVISQFLIPQGSSEDQWLEFTMNIVAAMVIPIAIGVAVLRYRLYDIDRIINRTLVYGGLTAILAGAYIAIVFALQAAVAPFTRESDLAIAASTLAVAAMFRPVRTRLQSFIDRRFYRRKFDAQRTLEEFNAQVRDEVALDSLSDQLLNVVRDTMEPAHVSLWLRDEPGVTS